MAFVFLVHALSSPELPMYATSMHDHPIVMRCQRKTPSLASFLLLSRHIHVSLLFELCFLLSLNLRINLGAFAWLVTVASGL